MTSRLNITDTIQQWVDKVNNILGLGHVDGWFTLTEDSVTANKVAVTGGQARNGTDIFEVADVEFTLPFDDEYYIGVNLSTEVLEYYTVATLPASNFIPVWYVEVTLTAISVTTDLRTWMNFTDFTLTNHLIDTTAHPSEYITYDNSVSGLAAADVQAAIDEVLSTSNASDSLLYTTIVNHINASATAHAGSAISYNNSSTGLSAINVQTAIDETNNNLYGSFVNHAAGTAYNHDSEDIAYDDTIAQAYHAGASVPNVKLALDELFIKTDVPRYIGTEALIVGTFIPSTDYDYIDWLGAIEEATSYGYNFWDVSSPTLLTVPGIADGSLARIHVRIQCRAQSVSVTGLMKMYLTKNTTPIYTEVKYVDIVSGDDVYLEIRTGLETLSTGDEYSVILLDGDTNDVNVINGYFEIEVIKI